MWTKWTGMLMELLFGPPLEDDRELTDEEVESLIEEADDYGVYSDYFDGKRRETSGNGARIPETRLDSPREEVNASEGEDN